MLCVWGWPPTEHLTHLTHDAPLRRDHLGSSEQESEQRTLSARLV
jgi:hypothetical protein